jgi:hypothetical protein
LSWKKYRYTVYEGLNDIAGQKALAMEFVKGDLFEYFPKLKALYTPDEWGGVLERLLHELENSRSKHGIYVEIIVHEGMKPRILAYCRQHPHQLTGLYTHLLPEHKDETAEMFENLIIKESEQASGRNHYQQIRSAIRYYSNVCGKAAADSITKALISKFPRRPAFIEELTKH